MPFRYAPHVMVATIAVTVVAFWPRYFSNLSAAPWAFHYHGLTATIWMTILALQGWSIHARKRTFHRTVGIAGLAFFPVFLSGNVAVVLSMAHATPTDPFYRMYGRDWASWTPRRPLLSLGCSTAPWQTAGACSSMPAT